MKRIIEWIKKKRAHYTIARRNRKAKKEERKNAGTNIARDVQQMNHTLSSIGQRMDQISSALSKTVSPDYTPALSIRLLNPTGTQVHVCNQCKTVHVERVNACYGCGAVGMFSTQIIR